MSTSVRADLAAILTPLIPAGWVIKPHTVRQVTTLSKPTLYLEHTGIDPEASAPVGHVRNSMTATLLDPHTDYANAEDILDPAVLELVTALDSDARVAWTSARKVEITETYLGWAVELTFITARDGA